MRLIQDSPKGPLRQFSEAHLYYALYVLEHDGMISRQELSYRLGLKVGSARDVVLQLRKHGLIEVRQRGMVVSEKGKEFMASLPMKLVGIPRSEYLGSVFQQAMLIKGVASRVTNGMAQRDSAVIAGAKEACVLVLRNHVLVPASSWLGDSCDQTFSNRAIHTTGITEDDIILITGAETPVQASVAAYAVAIDMI